MVTSYLWQIPFSMLIVLQNCIHFHQELLTFLFDSTLHIDEVCLAISDYLWFVFVLSVQGTSSMPSFLDSSIPRFNNNLTVVLFFCRDDQKKFIRVWESILWLDNWKKGLLYVIMGCLCFLKPHRLWLATISGMTVIVTHSPKVELNMYGFLA